MNTRARRPVVWGALGMAALAFCLAWPIQGGGGVQNSHYVLVKSLARGTPVVERALGELGDFSTNDVATFEGRTYSNKAPGFAFVTLPAYLALDTFGMRTTGDPARILWALGLWSVVLPTLLLVMLFRERAERLVPGFGTVAALTLGLGTLLLPYGTLFLSHALSACLVFGAFALLWRARERSARLGLVAAAGLLAGYAVTTEYPNGLALGALGIYSMLGSSRARRALAFGAGAAIGLLPLALYNLWAFGSLTHVSYSGVSGKPAADQWDPPSLTVALELLLSTNGLLILTPVVLCGAIAGVMLYRRGLRAAGLIVTLLPFAYLVLDSAYFSPFGGFSPGPRYLVPIVPVLSLGLAVTYRAFPATTGGLALVSATIMVVLTATHALAGYDGAWFDRLGEQETTLTVASLVGVTGWYTIIPFFLAACLAATCAVCATHAPVIRAPETALATIGVLAWALVAAAAPRGGDAAQLAEYGVPAAIAVLGAIALAVRAYALRAAPRSAGHPG